MTEISITLERLRRIGATKGGLARLADMAGVPYTTVHSFSKRDWSHKNLEVIEKLAEAASQIEAEDVASNTGSSRGAAA